MITQIIFERGLEYSSRPNAIKFDNPVATVGEAVAQIKARYNVRPVLLKEQNSTETPIVPQVESSRLISVEGVPDLDVKCSSLMTGSHFTPGSIQRRHNLAYVASSVVYHCKRLADAYSGIALDMVRMSSIPGHVDASFVSYSYQLEPYFELDALLTAARRAYDTSRYILWGAFGPDKGGIPSNFKKTLRACRSLPLELKAILEQSWETYGEQLTDYRDCIMHYSPIDFGFSTANMQKLDGGVWSVLMRIPDNPDAKSQAAFTFSNGLDALTYGWELTNEILRVATAITKGAANSSLKTGTVESSEQVR